MFSLPLIATSFSRRYKEKKEEVAEPEAVPEKDQRTVFAYQICLKANERDVYEFFSKAGEVGLRRTPYNGPQFKTIQRSWYYYMCNSYDYAKIVSVGSYIEFYDAMSVPMAIALSGLPLLGQPVMVKPSEAEKNLVQSTTAVAGVSGGLIGLYSGRIIIMQKLLELVDWTNLKAGCNVVFEAVGQVELVQLPVDETGHCKGYGFVQIDNWLQHHIQLVSESLDARNALSLNQQLEIAGRLIKVSALTDQAGMQDVGANSGDFDDDEGGGLSQNARSQALLMQKLDRSGSGSSVAGSAGTPVFNSTGLTLPTVPILGALPAVSPITPLVPALAGHGGSGLQVPIATLPTVDTIGVPSECLLLNDMFDPNDEVGGARFLKVISFFADRTRF
uniref:Splicing factor RBM39 linker domain-containing protein n=1 Tax=Quercus lobata TaxID=97700 RepID=A0A7N2LK63_QUELO